MCQSVFNFPLNFLVAPPPGGSSLHSLTSSNRPIGIWTRAGTTEESLGRQGDRDDVDGPGGTISHPTTKTQKLGAGGASGYCQPARPILFMGGSAWRPSGCTSEHTRAVREAVSPCRRGLRRRRHRQITLWGATIGAGGARRANTTKERLSPRDGSKSG